MKEQREKKAMINKIVYFTLTSAAEAPMGIVIRKAGLPPLFFSFLLCFFFLCPFLLGSLLFDEVAGVQRDITRTRSSMGRANFGSSVKTGVSPWQLPTRAYAQECCHNQLQKKWSEIQWCLPRTRSPPHLFCMLIEMFVLVRKRRVLSNFRGAYKPMT